MLKVSPAAELIWASPRELLNIFQADDRHDPVWVTQRIRDLLKEGRGSFTTHHRCRDGTVVNVRVNLITVNHNGRPVGVGLVETIRNAQPPNPHLEQQLLRIGHRPRGPQQVVEVPDFHGCAHCTNGVSAASRSTPSSTAAPASSCRYSRIPLTKVCWRKASTTAPRTAS